MSLEVPLFNVYFFKTVMIIPVGKRTRNKELLRRRSQSKNKLIGSGFTKRKRSKFEKNAKMQAVRKNTSKIPSSKEEN